MICSGQSNTDHWIYINSLLAVKVLPHVQRLALSHMLPKLMSWAFYSIQIFIGHPFSFAYLTKSQQPLTLISKKLNFKVIGVSKCSDKPVRVEAVLQEVGRACGGGCTSGALCSLQPVTSPYCKTYKSTPTAFVEFWMNRPKGDVTGYLSPQTHHTQPTLIMQYLVETGWNYLFDSIKEWKLNIISRRLSHWSPRQFS